MNIQRALIEMIQKADREGAGLLLDAWAAQHGHERLLAEVLEPTLLLIGQEWCSTEAFSLAQAYVAAKVAEDSLLKIAELNNGKDLPPPTKGPVVIGNIADLPF